MIGDVGIDQPVLGTDFFQHHARTHSRRWFRIEEFIHDVTPDLVYMHII
jgi:hypothetical protein